MSSPRRVFATLLVMALASMGAAGCASAAMRQALRAANDGDQKALAPAIARADARGQLSLRDAAELSRAVVRRQVLHATDARDAMARLRDVRACAFQLDDLLASRMKTEDAVGGQAALERAETGAFGGGAARRHATSSDDRWRAVGVWAMTREEDRDARRRGLLDGSVLVRRAALHAIEVHGDPADGETLLETARLDPDPLVRSGALRAVTRLHDAPEDLANRLRDLWAGTEDGLREDVALAFASNAVWDKGGREALARLLEGSRGNDAVVLAGAVLRGRDDDVTLHAVAVARLAAALSGEGHRARIHAIAIAPLRAGGGVGALSHEQMDALVVPLQSASRSEDFDVRLAALGRLSQGGARVTTADQRAAVASLEALGAPAKTFDIRGSRARLLLAEAGDRRAQAWIEGDLRSPDRDTRLVAADALAALGRASRAAPLLADAEPEVRTRVACTILLAARLR